MELVHLPHVAVPLLNALHRRETPSEEACQAFGMLIVSGRRWLEFQSAFTINDGEANMLANLACFWDELERAIEAPSPHLDALLPPLYAAIDAMDRIRRDRERTHLSEHPALHDLLLAGAAVLQQRGAPRAITERLPVVERWLENLTAMLRGSAPRLQPEACAAFETGIAGLRRALGEMREPATLEAGLLRARAADEVVSRFLDWNRHDHQRLAEKRATYAIPLVGPDLELALKGARAVNRDLWTQPVHDLLDLILPRLETWWGEERRTMLMPAEQRENLLEAVDMAIFEVRSAIAAMVDQNEPADLAIERYESSLQQASDAFTAVDEARWDGSALEGTTAGAYWEALTGVMAGTVPDVALLGLMHERALPDTHLDVRDALMEYLESGHTDALLRAAGQIIEHARAQSGPPQCPSCGGILRDDGRCRSCGDKPISISSWEA